MQVPGVLVALQDQGVIDRVVRPLKSGKEAEVFLVESEGELRVAKVYKSMHRSFKQRSMYTEGRKVRNTRDQRAIDRRTRHGKKQEEDAWKSAEVDIIHRLHAAGVRVPTPYNFIDGVLIMELVTDADGDVAPRLAEVNLDRETANAYYQQLLKEVVRMLCAGVIHGDLSDYNILVDANGPVVIDFPQAVDAAANRNAKKLLLRDVDNLGNFLERVVPGTRLRPYGQEIWAAFENNHLSVDMKLSGDFRRSSKKTNVSDVLGLIGEADEDERVRRGEAPRRRRGGGPRSRGSKEGAQRESAPKESAGEVGKSEDAPTTPRYRRMQVVETAPPSSQKKSAKRGGSRRGDGRRGDGRRGDAKRDEPRRGDSRRSESRRSDGRKRPEGSQGEQAATDGAPPAKRRRRRRRKGNGESRGGEARPAQAPGSGAPEKRRREGRSERRAESPERAQSQPRRADSGPTGEAGDAPRRRRRRRRGPKPTE